MVLSNQKRGNILNLMPVMCFAGPEQTSFSLFLGHRVTTLPFAYIGQTTITAFDFIFILKVSIWPKCFFRFSLSL